MTLTDKISYAAERKAFETLLDNLIKKGQTHDASQVASDLVAMVQRLHGDVWSEKSFQTLRMIANDPNGKWAHYTQRLLRDNDPYILKTFLTNAVYEGGIRGYHVAQETAAKYDINVPWLILMDPTSACNMHCTSCWAAEYGHKQSLTFEEMDKTLTEAKALGTHACLFTGGEPLMRKKDIIRLCEKHRDIAFHAFTNGTLIDDEFCKDMLRVGNFFVSVSIEGFEEANDGRRGNGHFQRALAAMDLMRSYRIPFGVSICYTSRNYQVVTSYEFLNLLISKGCVFAWYFHYMPVGNDASVDLLPTPEQRAYMVRRIREIRSVKGGKPIFAIDFQNDGQFIDGCVAGGRNYCHINPNGDVEPCVFIHYSSANINDQDLITCLQQPLFKEYAKGQPFNHNHLRPCPMLENPQSLVDMVKRTGAKSTDMQSPESVEHLCAKCKAYAKHWQPTADKLWTDIVQDDKKSSEQETS